jgi:hypothetical protein
MVRGVRLLVARGDRGRLVTDPVEDILEGVARAATSIRNRWAIPFVERLVVPLEVDGEWLYLEGGDLDLYYLRPRSPAWYATRRAVALQRRRRRR